MDPFTIMAIAGAVSAAAGVGGGMLANQEREEQANSANKWGLWMQQGQFQHQNEMANFNARQAGIARDWSENMSNTAYRRAMADMRAAGLNPMLAYQQGGASAGQAVAGSGTAGGGFTPGAKADIQDAISPGVSSAMHAIRTVQNIESAQEAIKQTQANTALQNTQTAESAARTANITQQTASEAVRTGLLKEETARTALQQSLVQAQTGAAAAQAGLASAQTGVAREDEVLRREQQRRTIEETNRTRAQANSAQLHYQWDRDWGPTSQVRDAAVSAEQISDRIQRSMREGLGPYFRINQN